MGGVSDGLVAIGNKFPTQTAHGSVFRLKENTVVSSDIVIH
jgi:hypothetical protein